MRDTKHILARLEISAIHELLFQTAQCNWYGIVSQLKPNAPWRRVNAIAAFTTTPGHDGVVVRTTLSEDR